MLSIKNTKKRPFWQSFHFSQLLDTQASPRFEKQKSHPKLPFFDDPHFLEWTHHCNITETCDESGKPNLIIDAITTPANISECEYLEAAIDRSNEKLPADKCVKEVITDGGYDSQSNREAMQEEGSPVLKMQGLI